MKKLSKLLLTAIMAVSVCCIAFVVCINAEDATVYTHGDFSYTVNYLGVTIVDCSDSVSGEVAIPAEIDGKSVYAIGARAFDYCDKLSKVELPDGVSSIGEFAFFRCYALEQIELGTGLKSIGDHAFDSCKSLKTVFVSYGIQSVGDFAFNLCGTLSSITLPSGDYTIGENTFRNCTELKSIIAPKDSVAYDYANRLSIPVDVISADSDADGELSNSDITVLVRYLAGFGGIESNAAYKYDVYTDGVINNRDVIFCIQKLAGWKN